jgi:hypothetical protein
MGQWSRSFRDSSGDTFVDKQGNLRVTCRKNNGTLASRVMAAARAHASDKVRSAGSAVKYGWIRTAP